MTAHALRQQLAQIADIQAALDALKTDTSLRLKEIEKKCTTAIDTEAATGATGISPFSGYSSAF